MRKVIILLMTILIIVILLHDTYKDYENTTQITGSASGTSTVSFRIISDCNIPLQEGWNLISICANMTNKTVDRAMRDIEGEYRYILDWNESTQNFLIYSPLATDNPFDELSENKSYFVYLLKTGESIDASGNLFNDTQIPLIFGWNTPIYPYEFETDIRNYLDSINNSYLFVLTWNASNQKFMIFSALAPENEFTNITGGKGQFIYITNLSGATLKYNKSALK